MDNANNFSHDKIMPMIYPKSQKRLSNFFSDSGEGKEVSESKRWQGEWTDPQDARGMSDRPLVFVSAKGLAERGRIYIEQGIYTSVGVIMIRFPRNT
jgi:hypothetical protein